MLSTQYRSAAYPTPSTMPNPRSIATAVVIAKYSRRARLVASITSAHTAIGLDQRMARMSSGASPAAVSRRADRLDSCAPSAIVVDDVLGHVGQRTQSGAQEARQKARRPELVEPVPAKLLTGLARRHLIGLFELGRELHQKIQRQLVMRRPAVLVEVFDREQQSTDLYHSAQLLAHFAGQRGRGRLAQLRVAARQHPEVVARA